MASLKQLATEIQEAIGQPNSVPVYERIKSLIIHTRAELIKRDSKNGTNNLPIQYTNIEVGPIGDPEFKFDMYHFDFKPGDTSVMLANREQIPEVINIYSNTSLFYLGNTSRTMPYLYVNNVSDMIRMHNREEMSKMTMYSFIDNNLLILSPTGYFRYCTLGHVFLYPHLINTGSINNKKNYAFDDEPFLMQEHMIRELKLIILKTDFTMFTGDDKESKIDINPGNVSESNKA